MAWFAVNTFSGTVVENSYISSQSFNADRDAQEALGWHLDVEHAPGSVTLRLKDDAGQTVRPESLTVVVGRPTSSRTDRTLNLAPTPDGYVAAVPLEPGNWMVLVNAEAQDGTRYHRRENFVVPAPE